MNDAELLREYASSESEAAFRALVERHLPLVYSAAVRQVGDPALAEDISQVVFTVLARKARQLSGGTILAGWLFRTTRHTATKLIRSEQRRLALPLAVIPGLLMTHGAQAAPSYLGRAVASSAQGQAALPTAAMELLREALRESPWPKAGAAVSKVAALVILGGLAWHFWPEPRQEDPTAYSFDTRMVTRPRAQFPRQALEPVPVPAIEAATVVSVPAPPKPVLLPQPQFLPPFTPPATNFAAAASPPTKKEPIDEWGPIIATMSREPPVRPYLGPVPTSGRTPYRAGYQPAWNPYPIVRRMQPMFHGGGISAHELPPQVWQEAQTTVFVRSSPWMPVQRPVPAMHRRWNSQRPSIKAP